MLRLHAEAVAEIVDSPALSGYRAVQKISGIELQARFGREHFQDAPGGGLGNPRQEGEIANPLIEHPVVIVAVPKLQLLIGVINARADGRRCREIEWRAFD